MALWHTAVRGGGFHCMCLRLCCMQYHILRCLHPPCCLSFTAHISWISAMGAAGSMNVARCRRKLGASGFFWTITPPSSFTLVQEEASSVAMVNIYIWILICICTCMAMMNIWWGGVGWGLGWRGWEFDGGGFEVWLLGC